MQNTNTPYIHELFMNRCLELAGSGLGFVAPNPMVGSVVVHNGRVIGEGYHRKYGDAHAEVNAIATVEDQSLLPHCTLYVNLEPCAHIGKTPPCSDLILDKKIPCVVIGTADPNMLVSGKGIEKLRKGGVEVITNVLSDECEHLNRRFFTFHRKQRPFVILKWAQTADGFVDKLRIPGEPIGINWISNSQSRTLVHRWRSEEQAILAGTKTVLIDNPQLNLRHWLGRSPVRVIIDRRLKIPSHYNVLDNSFETLVINEIKNATIGRTEYINLCFDKKFIDSLLLILYNRNILSLLVEGGPSTHKSFLDANLWDEARVFVGDKIFGSGVPAPKIDGRYQTYQILEDEVRYYRNEF